MTKVNITKEVQALHAYEVAKETLANACDCIHEIGDNCVTCEPSGEEDSLEYFFLPDDTAVCGDDWDEFIGGQRDVAEYWSYVFTADELGILDYHLSGRAGKDETSRLCHVLVLGTGNNQDFHHALFCVLKEFC